jgi:hypothetical protein
MAKTLAAALIASATLFATTSSPAGSISSSIAFVRVPNDGIQPEAAVDGRGVLHLVYFTGEPRSGNLFYVRSTDHGATFSAPIRVNSQDGSAIATGTIRGGQLAVARSGRVHVVWNGSDAAMPRGLVNPATGQPAAPFLYARSNVNGTAFEPQRNLTRRSYGIDGGGSIAADAAGAVYAAWHALAVDGGSGEDRRLVWVARSDDDGATFGAESPAWREPTGACSCCGVRLLAAPPDALLMLYRSATSLTHRDIYVLESRDRGGSFQGSKVEAWEIGACPMTSMSLAASGARIVGAWETAGQVSFGELDARAARIASPVGAPGDVRTRKHPRVAVNANGDVIMVWTEGTAWARGGTLAWQLFDAANRPSHERGSRSGIPVWSYATAIARPDGRFVILY